MTPSKKLFVAATLVAVGYAVAAWLGAPDPRLHPYLLPPLAASSGKPETATRNASGAPAGPKMVGSVRLLPESSASSLDRLRGAENGAVVTPTSIAPPPLRAVLPAVETPVALVAESSPPLLSARPVPRATLKNEAPRPLPAMDRPATQPLISPQAETGNDVRPAGFTVDAVTAGPMIQAPNGAPLQPVRPPAPVSPPPWPMVVETRPLRMHVIVDGDSLAKLAGRYLDDPRRSEEIFALNRGVLSDPELLPIGAELKIPSRGSADDSGSALPRLGATGISSVHAAELTGLVPVRALPATSGVMPRAQLLPPKPVE